MGDIVGDGITSNADQYEMPRNQIDFTVSKEFAQRWIIKLGVQDLLNAPYRLVQDSDSDAKITGVDESIRYYRMGQYANLSVVFKVHGE